MAAPLIVVGAGGHGRVVIDTAREAGFEIEGLVDPDPNRNGVLGVPRIGGDEAVYERDTESIMLANGLGFVPPGRRRMEIFRDFRNAGYEFASVIHPDASVAADREISEGGQVMREAVVQTGAYLGRNVIVNTGAVVDHDCRLERHCHVAPGGILAGEVRVRPGAFIGAGATVTQGTEIGEGAVVGAGAVVLESVSSGETVVGVPARPVGR